MYWQIGYSFLPIVLVMLAVASVRILREYERGVVVVNPQSYADTVTLGYAVRRITTQVGKNPDVNNGALVLGGSSIIVPARDARFLLVARDSVRPRPISDLLANTPTSSRLL